MQGEKKAKLGYFAGVPYVGCQRWMCHDKNLAKETTPYFLYFLWGIKE